MDYNAQHEQWISVKDRLPAKNIDVLAKYDDGNMIVGRLMDVDEDCQFWKAQCDDGWESDCDFWPTWWMPLPETKIVDVQDVVHGNVYYLEYEDNVIAAISNGAHESCAAYRWFITVDGVKYFRVIEYGATWRCWNHYPTQEERENTKWKSMLT